MLDTITYLPKLKVFEGVFSYMYLDTTGNVTVGVGNLLSNAAAAQKLAFVVRPNPQARPPVFSRPAAPSEIQEEFERIDGQLAGKAAGFYRQFTKLDLPDSAIDALLQVRVQQFNRSLCSVFPNFNSYPAGACAAIFDMAFNLGLGKLTSDFPHFCAAVRNQDWSTAAQQSHRRGINDERNAWTQAQLQKAAADASVGSNERNTIRP